MTAASLSPGDPAPVSHPTPPVQASRRTAGGDMGRPCRCGHGKRAHEHYRSGSDCAICDCRRFSRPFLQRLRGR